MGSTRLPGKVLKDLAGKPVLWHILTRIQSCRHVDEIVVATTDLPEDDPIVNACAQWQVRSFRGSAQDVLSRYFHAAQNAQAHTIVRITSDCPVIDPQIIDEIITSFHKLNRFTQAVDYLSNTQVRTYPRGLDTEVFTFSGLEQANANANEEYEREHVTPYFYLHPEIFKIRQYTDKANHARLRWTLDTEEDYQLMQEIYKRLYKPEKLFLYEDILKIFQDEPALASINAHVEQKKLKS